MATVTANAAMAAAWDGEEGEDWARDWERYDRAAAGYQARLAAAAGVGEQDHVLDVGCGNGGSTRAAAGGAPRGSALGVDLSSRMIERARELAGAAGLANARFERVDAQVHPFPPSSFDVVISRFGTMFFDDPVAAFANLGRATRPGGRLVMLSWQGIECNEWLSEVRAAFAVGRDLPLPPPGAPSPLAQSDPAVVEAVLAGAGWQEVGVEAAEEPFWLGADAADAFAFTSSGGLARGLLAGLDDADRARALAALRAAMESHDTGAGVYFGSAAWLTTARRPRA